MKHKFKLGNQSNALGNNAMAKSAICTETGKIFTSIVEAAIYLNIPKSRMYDMITGRTPNVTSIIYLI